MDASPNIIANCRLYLKYKVMPRTNVNHPNTISNHTNKLRYCSSPDSDFFPCVCPCSPDARIYTAILMSPRPNPDVEPHLPAMVRLKMYVRRKPNQLRKKDTKNVATNVASSPKANSYPTAIKNRERKTFFDYTIIKSEITY